MWLNLIMRSALLVDGCLARAEVHCQRSGHHFAHDLLMVPPTSNQAERDLRPDKIQQNASG